MIGEFLRDMVNVTGDRNKTVLRKYANNEEVRKLLKYTYDTTTYVYGIRPAVASPMNSYDRTYLTDDETRLLEALAARRLTGDKAQEALNAVIQQHGTLICLILNRNLQLGVGARTINECMLGLIPKHEVQLAKAVPAKSLTYPLYAEMKYDGVRITAIIHNGDVVFKTRNGKTVALPLFRNILRAAPINNMILDGELIFHEGAVAERTSVSGMVNSAMHGARIDEVQLQFVVFDHMSYNEFVTQTCPDVYKDRRTRVLHICKVINSLRIAPTQQWLVSNPEYVNELAEVMYSKGYEGLVLKAPYSLYKFKRSKDWIKIKQVKTVKLIVTGVNDGKGKYVGQIGALACEGTVEGKPVVVSVGSGLSDNDRAAVPEHFIGRVVEVKYNSVIRDSRTGQWSLFLPRYVRIRTDV